MRLDRPSFAKELGKRASKPLGWIAGWPFVAKVFRLTDIYWNCLVGKGSGGWDLGTEVRAAVSRIHRPNPVVFDVGANMGLWSQRVKSAIPGARIFQFEPSPNCQEILRHQALPDSKLFPCAVGEKSESRDYYSSSETDGSASLYVRRDTQFQGLPYAPTTVAVTTLDDVIESEKIDSVDFMKMDIEGHEFFALRGAQRSLAAGRIRALSFEFGSGNINSRTFFRDFWDLLTTANFVLYRVKPRGKDVHIERYYEDDEYFRGSTNFVAELKRQS